MKILKLSHVNNVKDAVYLQDIEILSEISSGNFGKVFKGIYNKDFVALKQLHQMQVEEFHAESRILT